jgi:hypothetical protein
MRRLLKGQGCGTASPAIPLCGLPSRLAVNKGPNATFQRINPTRIIQITYNRLKFLSTFQSIFKPPSANPSKSYALAFA